MIRFIFALHKGATSQQRSIVLEGMSDRFPAIDFGAFDARGSLENAIIPLVGTADPSEPDRTVVRMPPADLVDDIREVFASLLVQAKAARVN